MFNIIWSLFYVLIFPGALFTAAVGLLLAGIDRILNMARVIPNIVGDAAAAVMVAKSEGELHPELVKDED